VIVEAHAKPHAKQGWLYRFAHFPRRTFLRRALFQMHLWAGIGIGLLATVACVSGSAIVYKHALETHLTPSLYRTVPAPRASADTLIEHARALHPGWTLDYIDTGESDRPLHAQSPPEPPEPWIFYLAPPGAEPFDRDITAFLDPATGRLLGQRTRSTALHPATAIDWIAELHYRLLAGDTGLIVNGIGALLLFVLCVSGIIIWWPGRRHWRSHLKIHWHARWPRLNWDLHNVIGFWIALPLAIVALTGAFFCFYVPAATTMVLLLGGNVTQARQLLSSPQSTIRATAPVAIEPLLKTSLAAHPDCALQGITPAASATSAVLIRLAPPHTEDRGDYVQLAFDQYSGKFLSDIDSRRVGLPMRVVFFMGPLHFGAFAGHWSKIAWILVGLSPGLLFFTGFVMWWRRVISRRNTNVRSDTRTYRPQPKTKLQDSVPSR
jgi:uncharacterized iron-regulated membrane protein